MIVGRLSLYIARRFAATLAVLLLAVAIVIFLADYIEVLRRFSGNAGFSAALGVELAAMRTPLLLDTALPFAFLFGALLSLLGLSRKLELVVARASGVSAWGFLRAPFAVALLFGALATAILNPVAVSLKERAERLEAQLSGSARWGSGHWFRQEGSAGASIVHAGAASDDGSFLFGVTAFVFGQEGEFREKVSAVRAEYAPGRWLMDDAVVASAQQAPATVPLYELFTDLNADELRRSFVEPEAISVWSLPGFIATAERTGVESESFRVAFHALVSRPFFLVAMVLIAATVSLRLTRYGGTWRLVLTGAAIGFLLYALTEIASDLGGNGIIDPVLAAWLPPLIAMILGSTALLYQEDG